MDTDAIWMIAAPTFNGKNDQPPQNQHNRHRHRKKKQAFNRSTQGQTQYRRRNKRNQQVSRELPSGIRPPLPKALAALERTREFPESRRKFADCNSNKTVAIIPDYCDHRTRLNREIKDLGACIIKA